MRSTSSPSATAEPGREIAPAPSAPASSETRRALTGLLREHALLFGALSALTFTPLVVIALYVARHGGVLTGVNGGDYFDQFQYLAWIRDIATHGLASNLWVTTPTPHDYLQPMYLVSAILWRIGLGLQLAYLVWKPVALAVMFLGFAAYVAHIVPGGRGARAAALALALFYTTPFSPLAAWLHWLSPAHGYQLLLAVDDANAYINLWGFEHTAIAVGLAPVFLIACDRILSSEAVRSAGPGLLAPLRAAPWRPSALAALAGLLAAWLHPWQGAMLLGVVGGLVLLRTPRRRYVALAIPTLATLVPLLYGLALSHYDSSWQSFETSSTATGTAPWWALLASFGPLGLFAVFGLRRPRRDREWMLVLWLLARAVVYFAVPDFPPHALAGITLPLAVLAVLGWQRVSARVSVSRRAGGLAAAAAVLALTVPALVHYLQPVPDNTAATVSGAVSRSMYRLTDGEAAALRYLARDRRPGGVLAPWLLSMSVPGFTDRPVFAGHLQWEPPGNLALDNVFFSAVPPGGAATRRAILERSRAQFVIADCTAPAGLGSDIAPLARAVARFGCVTVYARG